MKLIREIARYAVGALFIFSGLIKINDPIGTAIKLEEYFDVFSHDIAPFFEIFIPGALFFAILLNVLEIVLGLALILGFRMKLTSSLLLAMIIFFTFLTFYSAYFEKVTDCGCFGDAIPLTPWQSFFKDIILLILIVIIFINRGRYTPWFSSKVQHITIIITTLLFLYVGIYAIRHLPYIDFRAYAIGNHLPTLMQPSEELRYEYIMEKEGEEFVFEKYPTDKSYQFKEMRIVNPEAQPKITDLSVWTDDGEFTEDLFMGNKLLIIIYSAPKAATNHIDEINDLANNLKAADVWVLTASGPEEFESFRHDVQLSIPYYYADATVLKTMVRSNPGIILMSEGSVVGKWHHNDVPSVEEINELLR